MNEAWHPYDWVMAHISMSHGTHMNDSHDTHMNESGVTH